MLLCFLSLIVLLAALFIQLPITQDMYAQYSSERHLNMDSPTDGFNCVFSGKANDAIDVQKFKSTRTGLSVVLAQVDGPLVNGYFCLATEAHDDDGLPHTLEHLVFMGSEEYPYKGVLDLLANRCLASGTNAWTDTDHTCYTMTTAGSEGFLNLMPIYLDHVLYPTLTKSAYITEVHHINGEGDDAGVVYCEMQARENTGESRTHLAMLREMYPGKCGYKSETGGMLEELRTSTSHKKVQDYHKEFYRPENLCLIVTGQVSAKQVLESIKPFEEKIVKKGKLPPYTRPWQSPVPPLPSSVEKLVLYPSDSEDNGMVRIAWRGPLAKEQYLATSMLILMEYLTDTAVAPLQRDFVEIEDPFCSRVSYSLIENKETCVYVTFQNVPVAKLKDVKPRLDNLLKKLESGSEKFDMSRMESVIHRRVLESMDSLEDQPHDTIAFLAIGDFLYGDEKDEFTERLNQMKSFNKLKSESQSYWTNLLRTYIVGKNSVTIIGQPSKAEMEKMSEGEKNRVKQQADLLGKDGLQEKEEMLQKATEENEKEPPESMLMSVDVPNVSSISFHKIAPSSNHDNGQADSNSAFPLSGIPVTFELDDIQTNFATMSVMLDTSTIPKELRLYLPLLFGVLMESPVMRDGELIPYEKVITELAADTLGNGAGVGIGGHKFTCGQFSQVATLYLKVEREKYKRGVEWLRELLFQTQFTEERLRIVANKLSNDVSQYKRNGRQIVQCLLKALIFDKESNHYATSMLRQHQFLAQLMKKLDNKDMAKEVIADMNRVREELTRQAGIRVHLAANVRLLNNVDQPQIPWLSSFLPKNLDQNNSKCAIHNEQNYLDKDWTPTGVVAGIGSVESSFLIQVAPAITDYHDPDIPALMVYIQYLTQLEGPMWRQIRGLGLSYHYSMYLKPDTGLIYFILFKSTQLVSAYKQAKEIVDSLLADQSAFSQVEFEASKSSLIFEIIEEEKTPADASEQSMLSYLRGVGHDYNRELLKAIPKVTLEDLKRVGAKYIAPLFDVTKSKVAAVCHPNKVDEVVTGFKGFSRQLTVIDDIDKSILTEM